ncbi:hypothetical protein D3C86_2045700 [compost metagenome]
MPGDEHLGKNRQGLHGAVDQAEHLGLFGAAGKVLGHQPRLLEVQEGANAGQQHHEHRDAQQVGRTQHLAGTRKRIAAQRF